MRFEGLELPKCNYWLERLNILFLVDPTNKAVPFISSAMVPRGRHQNEEPWSLQIIKNMIPPENIDSFNKQLKTGTDNACSDYLHIINNQNKSVPFRLNFINTGPKKINKLLVALPE